MHAQNSIEYAYDNAGNRIRREIILSSSTRGLSQEQVFKPYIEKSESCEITISPNPTEGILMLRITGMEAIDGQAGIYGIDGSLLYRTTITAATQTLNLSSYPNGVYILRLTLKGETKNWKIIKK
jgi:hypothetical protein